MAHQPRLFAVANAGHRQNHNIIAKDSNLLVYHVRYSNFSPGKPDVIFHAGFDKHAPVAASCKFKHFSSSSTLGLGDYNKPNSVIWEEFEKVSFGGSEYSFSFDIPGQGRRSFSWKHTRHVGIGNEKPHRWGSGQNYKMVDSRTGEVLAVYNTSGRFNLKDAGTFQLNVNYGRDFDTLIFLTGMTMVEKARRRARSSASAGAAGGGAGG